MEIFNKVKEMFLSDIITDSLKIKELYHDDGYYTNLLIIAGDDLTIRIEIQPQNGTIFYSFFQNDKFNQKFLESYDEILTQLKDDLIEKAV